MAAEEYDGSWSSWVNGPYDLYLESLPEANTVEDILRDFLDAVRHAVTLADVNVAAGIALQRLAA